MAERRMFTKKITDSDAFIKMSSSSQALYLHLNQGADDDGFNDQIANAMFKAHASQDDLQVLIAKRFVVLFENGVLVIKHWRMHNYIRQDRYKPTAYLRERSRLVLKANGAYTERITETAPAELGQPNGNRRLTQVSIELELGKDRGRLDTTTTTTSVCEDACVCTPACVKEGEDEKGVPPTVAQVLAYMTDELGEDVPPTEAVKFVAWNEKWGWDCLPNWMGAAALWCARMQERGK